MRSRVVVAVALIFSSSSCARVVAPPDAASPCAAPDVVRSVAALRPRVEAGLRASDVEWAALAAELDGLHATGRCAVEAALADLARAGATPGDSAVLHARGYLSRR